ncbi:MAG: PAS domain S-box protein [Anaerolineae bacterium]|nr:PAS domain S-box protein [Anaerolineae bacterium]
MATILVVDPHSRNREFLVTLLGDKGHRLLEAVDGAESLALARAEHPDLIITPILLLTMDVSAFVRQLRADPSLAQVPLVFYTASYLEPEARALAQACGVPYILPKPSEPEIMLATIETVLGFPPPPEANRPGKALDREKLGLLPDTLTRPIEELSATNQKLEVLIETSLKLTSERDPQRLLESFCRAARELMGASYATLSLLREGEPELHSLLNWGLAPDTAAKLGSTLPHPDILFTLMAERLPYRWPHPDGTSETAGFPPSYPPIHSLLAVPIGSPSHVYGWLSLVDKIGLEAFSATDEQLALSLATLVGQLYENSTLQLVEIQQHTQQLEHEIAERQQAEASFLRSIQEMDLAYRQAIVYARELQAEVAEHKRTQEILQRREQEYRSLAENALDIIARFDRELRHLYINPQIEAKTGLPPSAFIGRTNRELGMPEQLVEYWDEKLRQVFTTGQAETTEFEFPTPAGPGHFEARLVPEIDPDGVVASVLVLTRDITERKRAEATLRESEDRFRRTFDQSPIGAAMVSLDYRFLRVNEALCQITGYTAAELISLSFPDITHPDDLAADLDYVRRLQAGEIEQYRMDKRYLRKDGEMVWVHLSVRMIVDAQGQPLYFLPIMENITERKQAEIELEQRAVQLALINNISAQVTAVLEVDRLLDQAAFLIQYMFDYHHVALFLIEGEMLSLKAMAGLYVPYFPAGHTQRLNQGIIGRVATSGEKVVANDVSRDPHYISLIVAHSTTRSELCIPLGIAGQTIGVLDIQSPHLNGFSQNDVMVMEALAHQLAGAIANAHLYEQARQEISERQRVEQEISARNRELTLLNQIIAVSSGGQEIETILETTCRELAYAFNLARVTATLLNEEKDAAIVAAEYSAGEADLAEFQDGEWLAAQGTIFRPDPHDPLARYLLNQSGPLVVPEAQNDPRLVSLRETLRRRGIVSLLLLPLQDEGDIWGSLNLEAGEPRFFLAEEVALAWSVADQVAGALRRIRLEQKRAEAEAEVQASAERFRQVVASIGDHVYMSEITAEGFHLNRYISPNVEELTGYPLEKFISDAAFWPTVVIHPDDQALAAGQLSRLKHGENSEVEYRLVRADGQIIWVRDNGRVVPQADSILIYGIVSNITERKQAETALLEERALLAQRVVERTAELSAANAHLARAAQLKDEFLANMSHELRTPLNAILGMSEILRENTFGPLNKEQLNFVGHIEEGGRHLLLLINDILDLSKIEAGKLDLILTPVVVEDVCQASLRFIKQMAQKKQISLSFAIDSPISTIQADERRLKQILVNLLTNAVKFTPEGGQVKLEVVNDPTSETVCFNVHDTGIGIAPDDMERLFKPFIQLDSKLSRHQDGTGLGLSLVFRLTELHGGGVKVESRLGQGSKFTVSLPSWAEVSPAEPVQFQQASYPPLSPQGALSLEKPLILLAEDNEANIKTLAPYLQAKGYRLKLARNGSQTIQMAQEETPGVILMDIQMPVMDGLEAIRQLRANGQFAGVPIIALTALAMPGDPERCLAAGANAYLSKPVSLKGLVELIEQMAPYPP